MQDYIMSLGEASENPIKNRDKIGGFPTYLPESIPKPSRIGGHFLMELYNHGFGDEDIICWQFYQGEFGGPISEVIAIKKGALMYDDRSKLIWKRRWIHERPIQIEPCEPERANESVSRIGGTISNEISKELKKKKIKYFGTILENFCSNNELNSGFDIVIGFDKNGKMGAWSFD